MLALAPNFRRLILAFHAILDGTFDGFGVRKHKPEPPRCLQRRGENINEVGGVKQADGQFLIYERSVSRFVRRFASGFLSLFTRPEGRLKVQG